MAKITDFYKIASPTQPVVTVTDNQSLDNSYGAISNTSYHRVIQGGASRLARYNEYNAMDNDVEVARALDITAEEMTTKNTKTNLPIDLEMIKEESQEVDDTLVTTLNAAMRRWCDLHGFNDNRLFKLSRNLIKYGDCFFRKKSPYKKWEWVPAADVMGAVVDVNDITNIVAYQVRINTKEATNSSGFSSNNYKAVNEIKTEIVPASEMVVFSINDDMSDSAPFGESVLRTVYKTHKQKELLEDAIIIYRIQRAPERRVFYIDVGKMPPNRVKAYLETVKNEMRQKKIPSMNNNGQASVDSVYNPQSQLEDIYLAQRCVALDTMINIVGIGPLPLMEIIKRHNRGLTHQVYTVNQDTGVYSIGTLSWAGITRHDATIIKLNFSNGEFLECTPDHKILLNDFTEVQAQDIPYGSILCSQGQTDIILESIEEVDETVTTGCITVDTVENNHNFNIGAGIYIKNSDGAGSKVDVLQSGGQLGEQTDLDYFADKVLRGLRVPLSYMKPGEKNALFNDGKLGSAFVEEIQFAKYIERLQVYVEDTLDKEFKKFLFHCNINIDSSLYKLRLPKPSSYKQYQQAEIDNTLLGMVGTADGLPSLSKRFVLQRYLQLSEADMLLNEQLLKEERGLSINADKTLQTLYGQPGEGGMMGGGMGMGPDMGMGVGPDMGGMGGEMGAGGEAGMGGAPTGPAGGGAPTGAPPTGTPPQ